MWIFFRLCTLMICCLFAATVSAQQPPPDSWENLRREVPATFRLPEARYTLSHTWEAEGTEFGSQSGRVVNDPTAYNGKAREARSALQPNRGDPVGHLIFGPYAQVPSGVYVAFFRVKLLDDFRDGETVGDIDACVGYGQQILNSRELKDTDLAPRRYVQLPLLFRYDGGVLECRLYWRGYASLRVDRVTLFRVDGLDAPRQIDRVAPPQPSGKPDNLPYAAPPRIEDIFARSHQPADTLLVADIRRLPLDWQLMLLSLQGIVNRQRPQIYYLFNDTDQHWLDWMRRRGWVKRIETLSEPRELVQRFRSRIEGMVITDPTLPATRNVATMLASVRDAIVVSPRIARLMRLPVTEDLRGRWKRSVDAYRWALDTLWDRLNHNLVACSYPDHLALRDYLVQNRVFIFWISGPIDGARPYSDPNAEVRLAEEVLAKMPPNTAVLSYPWAAKDVGIGEGPGVTLFAEFGKYLVGSINCSNLTVHSGIRVERFHRKPAPPVPPLQEDKVYVSFIISDGDNLPVLTINNFPQLWVDKLRGSFPIGWTISPAARLLIPAVVDYFYQTSTQQDDWMTAVSGVGYTYPDHYAKRYRPEDRMKVLDDFLKQTHQTMVPMDLDAAWIMGITDPELIARYAQAVPSVRALFPDYGRRMTRYEDLNYLTEGNVPVFHAALMWPENLEREERLADLVQQVKMLTPSKRPAFLHLFVLNWFADLPMLRDLQHRLGDEYVVVRPNHLAQLYLQAAEREQVLMRAPERLATVAGGRIGFSLHLRNTTKRPLQVSTRVQAGLLSATISPASVELAPKTSIDVHLEGIGTGESVHVVVSGEFGQREVRIPVTRVEPSEVIGQLPELHDTQPGGFFEAEQLRHLSGELLDDPTASDGKAWQALPSRTQPGHIVFGPYVGMPAGKYLVLFRLKRLDESRELLVRLDTCVGGGTPLTAERVLHANELPPGQYRWVALTTQHPGGAIETRVEWFGRAGVAVDCVGIWRVR